MQCFKIIGIMTLPWLFILSACLPSPDQATGHGRVFVFGTFTGTENELDVVHTPLKDFGWLAQEAGIQFVSKGKTWTSKAWKSNHIPFGQAGYFSAILPPGEYEVNVRMPNRQVYLNHKFDAPESGKAYYLGHIDLRITKRFIFFILGACGYGTVDNFTISDELESTLQLRFVDLLAKRYSDITKSLLLPTKEGKAPSVDSDCGFLQGK